jgi:hypothetical protein
MSSEELALAVPVLERVPIQTLIEYRFRTRFSHTHDNAHHVHKYRRPAGEEIVIEYEVVVDVEEITTLEIHGHRRRNNGMWPLYENTKYRKIEKDPKTLFRINTRVKIIMDP